MTANTSNTSIANLFQLNPPSMFTEPEQTTEVTDPTVENDFTYARRNIYDAIGISQDAMNELKDIALQSQSAKHFEVLSNMIKTFVDSNKDLLHIQEKRKKLSEVPTSTQGGAAIGGEGLILTTAEIQRIMLGASDKKEEKKE